MHILFGSPKMTKFSLDLGLVLQEERREEKILMVGCERKPEGEGEEECSMESLGFAREAGQRRLSSMDDVVSDDGDGDDDEALD